MAVTALLYGKFLNSLGNKEIDLDTDTLKVMLCTSSYTPAQDTHQYKSDITNEVSGTGYTATGATLGSVTVTYTGATNKWVLDAADSSWTTSTITARYAVVYDASPASDAVRPLICYVDFGADVSTTAGTFQITWAAGGIVEFTVA
jgi:hypothetical protein